MNSASQIKIRKQFNVFDQILKRDFSFFCCCLKVYIAINFREVFNLNFSFISENMHQFDIFTVNNK